ncbi:MAG: YbhB/YbcL family Raf kinase inhibitor-like protein [Candidatus Zixiibacteriota bacterium]
MARRIACLWLTLMVAVVACRATDDPAKSTKGGKQMLLTITSTAFTEGGMIPAKYTCDGADISPPLSWNGVPKEAKSLALICDDPDAPAGTWVHWVIFNVPPDSAGLPEKVPPDSTLPNGTWQGTNDFRKVGYGGPCPPGGTHRYYFKLYALDTALNLTGRVTKADLLGAMDKHILAEAQLMGKYRRK